MIRNADRNQPYAQWVEVDVVFGPSANTDLSIAHPLTPNNPEAVDYQVLRKSLSVDVYHDTSGTRKAWSSGVIVLRATQANAQVSLLLSVRHPR